MLISIRRLLIVIFLIVIVSVGFLNQTGLKDYLPFSAVLCLLGFVFLHGTVRYGLLKMLVFFVITFLVSNFFEGLSIQTGFPFGFYHYDKLIGPRIAEVPLLIMPAYFAMGYLSWMLAHILLDQYMQPLRGRIIFFIPLVAAFIMVMWDLCMDPIYSNLDHLWTWRDGGPYFGVPLENYFGWFLVVFIIFQLFAWVIVRYDQSNQKERIELTRRSFWWEVVAMYGIHGSLQLLNPLTQNHDLAIYQSMALVTVFTMMFVTLLAYLAVQRSHFLTIRRVMNSSG